MSQRLHRFVLLPDLELKEFRRTGKASSQILCQKVSTHEVCPKCATPSSSIYDHREVTIKDSPIRGKLIKLKIKKRRLWCKPCKKPFTEPVKGVWPRARCTERYRKEVLWACENLTTLKNVRKAYRCSNDFVYSTLRKQLNLVVKKHQCPWPKTIGIDEHSFQKRKTGNLPFVTVLVDYNRKRLAEVVPSRVASEIPAYLEHIPGRENVKQVILDLADPYKKFAKNFFPNAELIADKFHVLRLLHPSINRYRKEITGDRRSLLIRKLLLMNGKRLDYRMKRRIYNWLQSYPELHEVYSWKERMHGFYRIKGYNRARKALIKMLDEMALSELPEIKRLRRTLKKWFNEILNYFKNRLTNGRTEGYNNKAKVIKRMAYGYRNFENYRLRLLSACY